MTTDHLHNPTITQPEEDAGTLLLVLLHTTLSDPRTYTALNFGAAGQFKSVAFARDRTGRRILTRLEVETMTTKFQLNISQLGQ